MRNRNQLLFLALIALLAGVSSARADNGSYNFSGGTFSAATTTGGVISVSGATLSTTGGQISFSCPITNYISSSYQVNWNCTGGTVTITTPDKSVAFSGTFVSGSMSFVPITTGSGRYSHTTYLYSFLGSFSGTITTGGRTQPVNGSVSQAVQSSTKIGTGSAPVTSGSFGWNSAYGPLLIADNSESRIVSSDSITGANLTSYGSAGVGTGQFSTISGVTEDAAGRIYILDSSLDRLARIDNLTGANWTQVGSKGTGSYHFNSPNGVRIDAAGKIWVADTGNNRIVRMDDMSGTNWTAFGSAGSGGNQFNSPSAIAFDALGRIYVADSENNRLVRFDDLTGKNWVSVTQVVSGGRSYPITAPSGVEVNAAGNIFAITGGTPAYLMQIPDITGANAVVSSWSAPLRSLSRSLSGTIYVAGSFAPGLAEVLNAAANGYFASNLGGAVSQPAVVHARPSPSPTPGDAVLSLPSLAFGNQNVGEPGPVQTVVLQNIGAAPLAIASIAASADYTVSSNCPASLGGAASCSVSVIFDPKLTGARPAKLSVTSNGAHPLVSSVLNGTGTAPRVVLLPASLFFNWALTATSSGAQTVTLTNTGTGPLTIQSIVATGDFTQSNNCGTAVRPGNGCTLNVTFHPTAAGTRAGAVTISDDATPTGAHQTVSLTGSGSATVPQFSVTPESIQFPEQAVGSTSAAQSITLKNVFTTAASLGTPAYPAGFKVTTTCGATLAGGASCTFQAAFAPTVAGPVSGVMSIPITGKPARYVTLSGTGTAAGQAPALSLTPALINFGQVALNDNPSQTITVTNTSGLPTAILSHSLTGAAAFTITGYNCPAILAGGARCRVQITFLVTSSTPFQNDSTLTIQEGSGTQTQVPVTGQAVLTTN